MAQAVTDLAAEMKARMEAKKRGQTYVGPTAPPDQRVQWELKVMKGGVLLAIFALVASLTSFMRREDRRVWACAGSVAVAALLLPLLYMALTIVAGVVILAAAIAVVGMTGASC